MANKTRFLRLGSLVSYVQAETDGDEIFIRYKKKKIAPAKSKFYKISNEPVQLNIEVPLEKSEKWVELELWEYDRLTPNDALGHFKLLVDQASDTFTAELIRKEDSGAKYVLHWEIIERLNVPIKKNGPASGKKKL
jgi:hypothetical protein